VKPSLSAIKTLAKKKYYLLFFSFFLAFLISILFWQYDWKKTLSASFLVLLTNIFLCEGVAENNRFFKMHYQYTLTFYVILNLSAFFCLAIGAYFGFELLSTYFGVTLITILFGRKLGQVSAVFLFFVFSLAFPSHWAFLFSCLLIGYITAELTRNVKRRIELSSVAFLIGAIQIGLYLLLVLFGFERFRADFLWKIALVPPASTVFVIGLLPYIEWISRIYSNIGLLELGNLNHPVLKSLITRAPGTYFHSTVLASFAEVAAEKIGCNPILARVGSFFHDIGKITRPDYFVENQDGENPHDRIKPQISHLVLSDHIKSGIELAQKHRLPLLFEDMVAQHHGTRVQTFFYNKAKEIDPDVDEDAFRYEGPKPSFKESGILMLADSCEAALKSVGKLDSEKARNVIKKIVLGIFEERELDNSGLSLSDLENIEEAFLGVYLNQNRSRIAYPQNRTWFEVPQKTRASERKNGKK
jgi:hypothetical protein